MNAAGEYQYLDLLSRVLQQGTRQANRTGVDTWFIPGAMMQFDLTKGFPLLTTKRMAWRNCRSEMLGHLRGLSNAADFRALGCQVWDDNANKNAAWLGNRERKGEDDLGRIYGVQWKKWRKGPAPQPVPRLREGLPVTYLGVGNGAGKAKEPLLASVWEGMMSRCYDTNSVGYDLYGGKGVYVENRWLEFAAFAEDAKKLEGWELRKSLSGREVHLDKDRLGDGFCYSASTCMWLTAKENHPVPAVVYTVEKDGKEYSFTNITEFCLEQGVSAPNFSDLWTGRKNASTRGGFSLVRVERKEREEEYVDQVRAALEKIMYDPTNRRIIINAWNPAELDLMALPPCHVLYQFLVNVEAGELNLCMYQRSCDMFLGVPFNIAGAALMLELFARITGYKARYFTHFLADVHVYVNHQAQAEEQMKRRPYDPPTLWMNPEVVQRAATLDAALERIDTLSPADVQVENYCAHDAITAPMAV